MGNSSETIKIPVIAFEQKGVRNYVGVMKARDILDVWHVERFIDDQVFSRGYQRQEEEERMRQVYEYVEKCQLPIIPAILASIRENARFIPTNKNSGILELPRIPGALEIVDGQHRVGGFYIIKRLVSGERIGRRHIPEEEIAELEELLDFEIPVHFIDAFSAVEKMKELATPELKESLKRELGKTELGPEDIERVHFFVINKTQKAIRPSLKDTLAYLIYAAGIRGIPIIEKEKWKAEIATPLTLELHFSRESPLRGMINVSGARGLNRPIQLASFVSSLKPLAEDEYFRSLSPEQRTAFLKAYWWAIRDLIGAAFDEDTRKEYMILRTMGVYVLNRLAADVLHWCKSRGIENPTKEEIKMFLEPLKEFDWKRETSPIAAYGGAKGVYEAYKVLLEFLGERGVSEAAKKLQQIREREEQRRRR